MNLRATTSFVRQSRQGFTLPELAVAMGIFLLMIAAVISSHIFGLKMYEIAKVKLGASDKARKAISNLSDEIRRAKQVDVGSYASNSFTKVGINARREGNAIQIYNDPEITNQFVLYYRDTDKSLKRMSNNVVTVIAGSVTNEVVFTKEDAFGNFQTNDTSKYVIGMTLQFYDLDFVTKSNRLYDFYQLQTKISPRN